MARRMFDTGKYEDPWYRKLTTNHKCIYDYFQSKCDHAGILDVDIEDLNYKLRAVDEEITFEKVKEIFSNKIVILEEENNKESGRITRLKIFLPRFIFWQYQNELTPANPVTLSAYRRMKQEGINSEPYLKQYVFPSDFDNWEELRKNWREIQNERKGLKK